MARLKEEAKGSEVRRSTLEQDLRRLHDEHSDMVKKLSHAEASLQIALKVHSFFSLTFNIFMHAVNTLESQSRSRQFNFNI